MAFDARGVTEETPFLDESPAVDVIVGAQYHGRQRVFGALLLSTLLCGVVVFSTSRGRGFLASLQGEKVVGLRSSSVHSQGCSAVEQKEHVCESDPGGSCLIFSCDSNRGKGVTCVEGKCLCGENYCARNGACVLNLSTMVAAVFPVTEKQPIFPDKHGEIRSGLAVSGGGSRSLALTMGYLRALEDLDLMKHVDAVSAVSGGSWATAIYMFANVSTEELLGSSTPPSDLTLEKLKAPPPLMGLTATSSGNNFLNRLTNLDFNRQMWTIVIEEVFLEPFGLDGDAYMAASEEARDRIVKQNPLLASSRFLIPRADRPPVFIIGAALFGPKGFTHEENAVVSLQISPDWTGSPFLPDKGLVNYEDEADRPPLIRAVGGGFVETFAFGGTAPDEDAQSGTTCGELPAPKQIFTLAQAIGISSAAFSGKSDLVEGFSPQVTYWPISDFPEKALTYQVGDGGAIDNAGVIPLLQRRATNIVWLINSDVPVCEQRTYDFCNESNAEEIEHFKAQGLVTNQFYDKFGFGLDDDGVHLSNNKVFAEAEMFDVLCEVQNLQAQGVPTVMKKTHTVQANSWWGIPGGFNVTILYVFNQQNDNFIDLLPDEVGDLIGVESDYHLEHFPNLATALDTIEDPISLSPVKVQLLAGLAEYLVRESEGLFRDVLAR